jgi:hypothetical protein
MTAWVYFIKGETYREPPEPSWTWKQDTLYIGSTGDIGRRLREHEQYAEWWPHMASLEVLPCVDRQDAFEMEKMFIALESPPYNKTRGGGW